MNPAGPIPPGPWRVMHADPAWQTETWSARGLGRSPEKHYRTMSTPEIAALPAGAVAGRDCALFLWAIGPRIFDAQVVMTAWGFAYSGMAFVWIKTRPGTPEGTVTEADLTMGGGHGTRKNAEFCLLGTRGRLGRRDAGVHEVILSPRRKHSQKPVEAYRRIERLLPGPYLELFARPPVRPGWAAWGDQL